MSRRTDAAAAAAAAVAVAVADSRKSSGNSRSRTRWGSPIVILLAALAVSGDVKSSVAMPPREYGTVDSVSLTHVDYRGNREPVNEDDDYPISPSSFPENARSGRQEDRYGDEERDYRARTSGRRPEVEVRSRDGFLASPVSKCMGKTFCEETSSEYPEDYVKNIISNTASLHILSGVDMVDVNNRFIPSEGEIVCDSETKVVFPKIAQTSKEDWLYVIQDESTGFKQGIRVENCGGGMATGTCQIVQTLVSGYETSCKQKYVSRVLATIGKNGTATMEKFSIPSSCCCEIKLIGTVASRLGIGPRNGQSPAQHPTRRERKHGTPK